MSNKVKEFRTVKRPTPPEPPRKGRKHKPRHPTIGRQK